VGDSEVFQGRIVSKERLRLQENYVSPGTKFNEQYRFKKEKKFRWTTTFSME
jgi:hypothetical protein